MHALVWATLASDKLDALRRVTPYDVLVKVFTAATAPGRQLPVFLGHQRGSWAVGRLVAWEGHPRSRTIRGVLYLESDSTSRLVATRALPDVSIEFIVKRQHQDADMGYTIVDDLDVSDLSIVDNGSDPEAVIQQVQVLP